MPPKDSGQTPPRRTLSSRSRPTPPRPPPAGSAGATRFRSHRSAGDRRKRPSRPPRRLRVPQGHLLVSIDPTFAQIYLRVNAEPRYSWRDQGGRVTGAMVVREKTVDPWTSPVLEAPLNEPTYLRVKRAIIGDLVSGQFVPGTHLTIDALTSRYAVSHMPIREALRQLEGEGILISLAHRGFRIEAITEGYIRNIYDIRVGIESMLAHRAVERATNAEVATLRQLHEDLSVLIRSGKPMVASRENIVFHKRIYEIAKNPEAELIL